MRLGVSILLAVLAILFAGRIGLAEPLRVSTLETRVTTAAAQLSTARADERSTREAQDALAHRIAALKRKGTDQALLEQLLRESVEADRVLSKQVAEVRRLEQSFS